MVVEAALSVAREIFYALNARSILLGLLLATLAIYFVNECVGALRAISQDEAGIKGASFDACRFSDFARKPEFILLLVTAAGAAQGVRWWIGAPLCLAGLSIARLPKFIAMWPHATQIEAEWQVILALAVSSVLNLASAVGIFAIGTGVAWVLQ